MSPVRPSSSSLFAAVCLALTVWTARAVPIDNGVKGYPKVTCGLHSIRVDVDTERPFQGRVFVKGESYNKDCIKSFAGSPSVAPPQPLGYGVQPAAPGYGETVGIELGFGHCNMRRQRTLFPRGVEYTFTLVVSFHPLFITKVDKAYRVRCFYMEAEKTVAQQLDVSMLTTHQLNEQFPMPQCRYHIKRGGPDGPYIRYARVGEPVHHIWECDAPAAWLYGILVKNCYVDDGQGNRVELLDERGCANDRHILPDLTYDQSLISAWVESHVFKYADKPHLYFTCTIVLCFKQDGGCNGITPPNCLGSTYLPKPLEPVLPVPGPYPQPAPLPVPALPPAPPPVPVPGYGPKPVPYAPFNRDAPLVDDRLNGTVAGNKMKKTADSSDKSVPAARSGADSEREKREASNSSHTAPSSSERRVVETDLSAQPVIVLPFEEDDGGSQQEDLKTFHDMIRNDIAVAGFKRPYAIIPGRTGSMPVGVCVSPSGFGVLVALFLALFLLSTTLTVLVARKRGFGGNSKI